MAVSGCSIIHLAMLGLEVDQVIEAARALKAEGVDMIDCSTGGIGGQERPRRMKLEQGFQAPFSESIRNEADIATMAVTLSGHQREDAATPFGWPPTSDYRSSRHDSRRG